MTAPRASPVRACRSCAAPSPSRFLSLGETPIANALLRTPDEPCPTFPLDVGLCEACGLVQLLHELPAEALFDADYPYYSSYSESVVAHARSHVEALVRERALGAEDLVVEVASNDGYLLREVVRAGVPALGVEPSPGPAAAAVRAGVPTVREFLTPQSAERLRAEHGAASVVLANNVMAHVPDLNGFVQGLATLLADGGVLAVENPGVQQLVENRAFDTVYHEHYCYFSTIAVQALMARHGLVLNDVEEFPGLHGGTLRWWCSHGGTRSARLERRLAEEAAAGVADLSAYQGFAAHVGRLQAELRAVLQSARAQGLSVAAYGAAAKGATLLNSSGIDVRLIDYAVDRNPHKQGRFLPGARVPIVAPEELSRRPPDVLLLLAWNVEDEVRRQQRAYLRAGGRLLVPVPWPRLDA
ncbi:MAG TPA: class I SAM-dependent methyltransferase [Mycobacteriales bacterium]|nr:class I SAM-dependent methyltransferase [Mycobacteriales bacterium]